ncbi:unnamed protein product [Cyprideis torosa]|uniref:Uncharacterized protein n=1 Tax=Cyprideis torosa TaxID=163714 RepID=A0A7R8ZTS8_9CRUS|nr:unnamed protein product [Cyprideis torosa]CAG0908694.1 unnamed protein product [Cyprideis torosa]
MSSPKMANGMTEEARSPSSSKLVDEEQPKCALKCRHIFALMGFLGYINVYALRVNISVAIVGMVNNTAVLETIHAELEEGEVQEEIFFSCPVDNVTLGNTFENGTISNTTTTGPVDDGNGNGEFNWDATTQGLILGSFFWGYVFTQLPGGIIAKRFGGKWVYGIGTLLASVFALLTPVAARWGVGGVVSVRVIQGLGEGVVFPATHCLMSQWVPPLDRSRYSSFVYLAL